MGRALVLGITGDYAFAAGALIASIRAHDPGFDADIVILNNGLAPAQEAAFRRLWGRTSFRRFTAQDVARRAAAGDARLAPLFARFSPLLFAKLELPALLDDWERVVWMDADMLARGPLQGLWDFETLAWRPLPEGAFARRDKVLAAVPELRRDPAVPLMNGGVIGVARPFRDRFGCGTGDLYAMAQLMLDRTSSTQVVELAWYLLAATRSLPVTALPLALNHPVTTPGVALARAIHAIGPHKFWNATPLRQLFPDWAVHQATWVACGGEAWEGELLLEETHPDEAAAVLRAAEMRAFWLAVMDDLRALWPAGLIPELRSDRKALRLFLAGRTGASHLRLVRLANERRLGVEAHLPEAAAVLEAGRVTGARVEEGVVPLLNLPRERAGEALRAMAGVLGLP